MTKKTDRNNTNNYFKISQICQIIIDKTAKQIISEENENDSADIWKSRKNALEIMIKLVSLMSKLKPEEDMDNIAESQEMSLSKNDIFILEKFLKKYHNNAN